MILADTSVWIDHLRGTEGAEGLGELLADEEVFSHPFVLGELALGHLGPHRKAILQDLEHLPAIPVVPHKEVFEMIHMRRLFGRGIGWVDCHLLAAALVEGCALWTLDRRLGTAAEEVGLPTAGF